MELLKHNNLLSLNIGFKFRARAFLLEDGVVTFISDEEQSVLIFRRGFLRSRYFIQNIYFKIRYFFKTSFKRTDDFMFSLQYYSPLQLYFFFLCPFMFSVVEHFAGVSNFFLGISGA